MNFRAASSGPPSLREAAATVHRDGRWWAKCLGYGAAVLTGVGLPLAAGFVMESLDNTRRGFPTPLPPWTDPSLRWLTGLFCLLIDFCFFVLPFLAGGMFTLCAGVGLTLAGPSSTELPSSYYVGIAVAVIFSFTAAAVLLMFVAGAAPVGRLIFAREGRAEDAIGAATLRWALGTPQRASFLRARLASLPAYLPALLLGAALYAAGRVSFPGQLLAVAGLLWLTASALVYAHLVVAQLYVAAEREAQRRGLGM